MPGSRLDDILVARGLFPDRRAARGPIMAGDVLVDDQVISAPGTGVSNDAGIRLRKMPSRYASRGGYKLAAALQMFEVDVEGIVALDVGAAAGGFTDCLLQRGASHVYAVDAGFGQMRGKLAVDSRVTVLERTNLGDLKKDMFPETPALIVVDLSYLSLRTAAPALTSLFVTPVRLICLVKPLYEGLSQAHHADTAHIEPVLEALFADLADLGHEVAKAMVSPILGGRGAVEFLILIDPSTHPAGPPEEMASELTEALQQNPPVATPADS